MPVTLPELERRRVEALRLEPERALQTLDEAESWVRERGVATLMPSTSLPSLFAAVHEPPYKPGGRGFAQWPATKWRWGFELCERPSLLWTRLLRGLGAIISVEIAALADPLCRDALASAEEGEFGDHARRLVAHLRDAGPSLVDELKEELGFAPKELRAAREPLHRRGAILDRSFELDGRFVTELVRWDERFPEPREGCLAELFAAAVRAAVIASEREAVRWFTWKVAPETVDRLVEEGRLARLERGLLTAESR